MKFSFSTLIIGLIFTSFGGFLFYKSSYDVIINSFESKHWPTVEAVVTYSKVNNHAGEDRDMFHLVFEASYTIDGKKLSCNSPYLINGGSTSWAGDRYRFVNRHPVGSKIKLYYHPEKPWISTMEPGFHSVYWEMILFTGLFFFIGLLFVISPIIRYFVTKSKESNSVSSDIDFV